LEIKNFIVH